MTWIKEVSRRLAVFYVILLGSMTLSLFTKRYLLEQGIETHIAGPVGMFVFLPVLIWTVGQLKFERL